MFSSSFTPRNSLCLSVNNTVLRVNFTKRRNEKKEFQLSSSGSELSDISIKDNGVKDIKYIGVKGKLYLTITDFSEK